MKKAIIAMALVCTALIVGCSKYDTENGKGLEETQVRSSESECEGGDDEEPLPILRGTVQDTITFDSLQGVCVSLLDDEDNFVAGIGTDSQGHFYFNLVANGSYKLVLIKLGYYVKTVPITINSSAINVNVKLRPL